MSGDAARRSAVAWRKRCRMGIESGQSVMWVTWTGTAAFYRRQRSLRRGASAAKRIGFDMQDSKQDKLNAATARPIEYARDASVPNATSAPVQPDYPPGFRARRGQNWFFLGLTYASYYLCRYNLSPVAPELKQALNLSNSDYG